MKGEIVGFVCGGSYLPIDATAKCNWLNCVAGCGLAGSGHCFLWGDPMNADCPKFENEAIYELIEEWACMQEWLADSEPCIFRLSGKTEYLWG